MREHTELKSEIKDGVLIKINELDIVDGVFNCSEEITTIKAGAFQNCLKLTTANLHKVTEIEQTAFAGCLNLTTVFMPEVKNIQMAGFVNCNNLSNITMPKITDIESYAFQNCTGLTTLIMPEVNYIGMVAFEKCTNLTTFCVPRVQVIDYRALKGCTKLSDVVLPQIVEIKDNAFDECTNLKYLIIDTTDQTLDSEQIRNNLPENLRGTEIVILSEQIKHRLNVKEYLNQSLPPDVHPNIVGKIGFFTSVTQAISNSELKEEDSLTNNGPKK